MSTADTRTDLPAVRTEATDDYVSRHLEHAARAHGVEACRPELDFAVTAEYPVFREEEPA